MSFDLLSTVTYGGCSAKIPAALLSEALSSIPKIKHKNLLIDIETHDDAGVYQISDDLALIQTTDFFPPLCSDPYDFGQIAAANSLSDVYAMGGKALTAMNLVMFPSTRIPLEVLKAILEGGQQKVAEAEAVIVGGHTIDDYPPKYGLAVTGTIHPRKIVSNAAARAGDILILTKPIGTGILIAGKRLGETDENMYSAALQSMKQLNDKGAELMGRYGVRSATDITGFGLLGHAMKMAEASGVSFSIESGSVPIFQGTYDLVELGCIPGACFRNLEFTDGKSGYVGTIDYNRKMLLHDAQTSGGLFIAAPAQHASALLDDLRNSGYPASAMIGEVLPKSDHPLIIH